MNLRFIQYLLAACYSMMYELGVVHRVEYEDPFSPKTNAHQNHEDGDHLMPSSHERHEHREAPLTE